MLDTTTIVAAISIFISAATFILHFVSTKAVVTAKKEEVIRREVANSELAIQLSNKLTESNKRIDETELESKELAARIADHSIMISVIEERLRNEISLLQKLEDKLEDLSKEI